ncbi:MAG: hypothetical protein K5866_07615 [Treponema sp.]|nr:hypothetical protein [Treponema sp.]
MKNPGKFNFLSFFIFPLILISCEFNTSIVDDILIQLDSDDNSVAYVSWSNTDLSTSSYLTLDLYNQDTLLSTIYLSSDVVSYTLSDLEHQIIYTIVVSAFDSDGNCLASINNTFFLPVTYYSDSWFLDEAYSVCAHAGGSIDGYTRTNCKEAFYNSYQDGYRFYECDIEMTDDDIPVLVHDWTLYRNMTGISEDTSITYELFLNTLLYDSYSPMTLEDLVEFMLAYPDVYVDLDLKTDDPLWVSYFVEYGENLSSSDDEFEALMDRLVIEFWDVEIYQAVSEAYDFKNYIFSNYYYLQSADELLEFCIIHNIPIVGPWYTYCTADYVSYFEAYNVKVYTYGGDANSYPDCTYLKENGVFAICSDYVTVDQWNSI